MLQYIILHGGHLDQTEIIYKWIINDNANSSTVSSSFVNFFIRHEIWMDEDDKENDKAEETPILK